MKTIYYLSLAIFFSIAIATNIQAQTYSGYDPEMPTQPAIVFKNTSLNALAFLWHFGIGDSTNNQEHPSYTYPNAGEYEVTLIAISSQGERDTVSKVIKVEQCFAVDVKENTAEVQHHTYPNPAFDQLTFNWQGLDISDTYRLKIFNNIGQVVQDIPDIRKAVKTIDVSSLWRGVYYYSLNDERGKQVLTGRFLKN